MRTAAPLPFAATLSGAAQSRRPARSTTSRPSSLATTFQPDSSEPLPWFASDSACMNADGPIVGEACASASAGFASPCV
jgi:hypothetical protein